MKRPPISLIQRKSRRSGRGLPPPEIQELLDHLAKELAAEYLRLLTPEPGRLVDRTCDKVEVNK